VSGVDWEIKSASPKKKKKKKKLFYSWRSSLCCPCVCADVSSTVVSLQAERYVGRESSMDPVGRVPKMDGKLWRGGGHSEHNMLQEGHCLLLLCSAEFRCSDGLMMKKLDWWLLFSVLGVPLP